MGTSADYGGGKGGNWTTYKHATSNFAKRGEGRNRVERVLTRYVAALGGGAAAAGGGGAAAATTSAQRVARFGAGLAADGLTPTLEHFGLGHLVGHDRFEVLDGLLEALGGDGATLDDQAILAALCESFGELYPEEAETYTELEEVGLDTEQVVALLESFVAAWVYNRMLPTLAEKFTHIEDPEEAAQRDGVLRERIRLLTRLELEGRDPLGIDWPDDEGRQIVEHLIADLYDNMEDLEG